MPTNIHTVPIMPNRTRNTTKFARCLKNSNIVPFRTIILQQLIGSSKASRATTNDHNRFFRHLE